ncbi:MAG: hypothetical protein E6Q88_03820 [Lysobacteraceae bacterium]|nr:MAG: hypothetical protein E6Q88_03820 [Xanthomonadaceae bacterium]
MSRWKASALHLIISFLVVGSIAGLIYFLWFPYHLIRIAGMDRLLLTMLGVDIVAGPLLTLIVFKAHDLRQTRRDLAVIGLLQLSFMAYAVHTAWITRPVFLIWSVDQMHLLYANEIEPRHLAQGRTPETRSLSWTGPRLFAVSLPKDHEARAKIFEDIIREQSSLERLPEQYAAYEGARAAILKASDRLDKLPRPKRLIESHLDSAVASSGRRREQLRLVPISSSRDVSYLLLDAETAAPIVVVAPTPVSALPAPQE